MTEPSMPGIGSSAIRPSATLNQPKNDSTCPPITPQIGSATRPTTSGQGYRLTRIERREADQQRAHFAHRRRNTAAAQDVPDRVNDLHTDDYQPVDQAPDQTQRWRLIRQQQPGGDEAERHPGDDE